MLKLLVRVAILVLISRAKENIETVMAGNAIQWFVYMLKCLYYRIF